MTIDIIGAGIGGLTTAIALQQKGIQVRVFEQANTIKPVGAGIVLANNAMQVFDKLGLKNEIEAQGNPISSLKVTQENLNVISSVDLGYFEEKHQVKNIAIHRADLQRILLSKLRSEVIYLDHELDNIEENDDKSYTLTFKNGKTLSSEVIIGADGIHSKVRNFLFPKSVIRNAKQVCWRGVTNIRLPEKFKYELNECWGKGDRFGFVRIKSNRVYWYALKNESDSEDYDTEHLEDYFKDYHPMVQEIIRQTPLENIHTSDILDLKPNKSWFSNNACLIGDAAHAATPNLGQGACQSIEDAYVLSECLSTCNPATAFTRYERLRMSKAHLVVNKSWRLGKIAHHTNPVLITLRNTMMRMIPKTINRKQSELIFELPVIN